MSAHMYVKVCGITHIDDALAAVHAGVDVLGFNRIPSSKRFLDDTGIVAIIRELRRRGSAPICVAVVADLAPARAAQLCGELGVDRVQLHGDEPAADLAAIGRAAFKAVRIADAADVERAATYPGSPLLVDAKVDGQLGGTGQSIDWPLVETLARSRALVLAGGLTPENVAAAVRAVRPWAVDVASGVEAPGDPRRKDHDKLRRFVAAARGAVSVIEHAERF
jgi:phosphoribosylanthranilate isomerase